MQFFYLVPSHSPEVYRYFDIGKLIKATMSVEDIEKAISDLPPSSKYEMIKAASLPSKSFIYPVTHTGGCNREFKPVWVDQHPWMRYSVALDGIFCICCSLFSTKRSSQGKFVNAPFVAWSKKTEKANAHNGSQMHLKNLQLMEEFVRIYENPQSSVPQLGNEAIAKNVSVNRAVVKTIAEALLLCGRQCIAIRGDNEKSASPGNPGNFLAIMKTLGQHDPIVQRHLISPATKNTCHPLLRTKS
jgi:hypothetical protein